MLHLILEQELADGTSYEEAQFTSDISIASNGAVTIAATSVEK